MSDETPLHIHSEVIGLDRREVHHRLALRGLLLALSVFAGSNLLAFAFHNLSPCLVNIATPFLGLLSLALLAFNALRGLPRLGAGTLVLDQDKLTVDLRESASFSSFARSEIIQGFRADPDRVHLAFRDGSVLIVGVRDPADRERLLRAVGVGAEERVLRVPLASASSQLFGGAVLATFVLVALLTGLFTALIVLAVGVNEPGSEMARMGVRFVATALLLIAALSAASYAVFATLRRREVVIGADGLVFRRSLRRQRIPYADVARVALDPRGVQIALRDGARVSLPTSHALRFALPIDDVEAEPPRNEADARRRQLFARIREAMSLGGSEGAPELAQLDRGDLSFPAWRKALRDLATTAEGYRRRPLSTADLGAIIDDHAARAERRIAAAVALSAREPEEARRRVRIAAKVCADEELAAALSLAAEGEIAEALIVREEARRRADDPGR